MKKKILVGAVFLILLVGGWIAFDKYYYSPPTMSYEKIAEEVLKELEKEVPGLLKGKPYEPYQKEFLALEILDVAEIDKKTYLVFKLDFDMLIPEQELPYNINNRGYILGLRLVEKKWGGLRLKEGMNFNASYMGVNPVDCGWHPEGVFYGFCKDPRVSRTVLTLQDGQTVEIPVKQRVILAGIPKESSKVEPRFFDVEGREIDLSYGIRVAFVTEDEKIFEQYERSPLEWWPVSVKDIQYLSGNSIDALWIFPDQQEKVLQEERHTALEKLLNDGVPLIFVGLQDIEKLAGNFDLQKTEEMAKANNVEAVYLSKAQEGLKTGFISLDDSQNSPLVVRTLALKYDLEVLTLAGKQEKSEEEAVPEKEIQIPNKEIPITIEGRSISK